MPTNTHKGNKMIYLTYNGSEVIEAFGFIPDDPYIEINNDDWGKFVSYSPSGLEIIDGAIHIKQTALELRVLTIKLQEAQALLDSTQFKFGDDYDQKDTSEWLELKAKRQVAREFVRANS